MTQRNETPRRRQPVVAGRRPRRLGGAGLPPAPTTQAAPAPPPGAASGGGGSYGGVVPPADPVGVTVLDARPVPDWTGVDEVPEAAPVAVRARRRPARAMLPRLRRSAGPRRHRPALRTVAAVLAPLALASAVGAGVLLVTGIAHHDHLVAVARAEESARTDAAAAAKAAATAVLSYDYRHFDSDVAAAESYLTGRLRSDYDHLQRATVEPTARQVHASVKATVHGVAVLSATADTATVLVFVDQLSRNDKINAPRLDQDRVRMQLQRQGSRWLVTSFEAL